MAVPVSAKAETRTLKMYYTHSKESATITFKKNGRYVKSGLREANRFLRDWRRKEPTRMDPELLDLVWEVYQKSGSRSTIYVISGYRSPKTNSMLRRRGRAVAKTSQHTQGKALDFFLKDVSVSKLRELGLKAHRGGVGYYSGSFVHLDTGRVRHWPRMSKRQLAKVFPDGKTIHVPSNGKPLRGYKTAMLNLKKGLNADGGKRTTSVQQSLLARIFSNRGSNDDEGEEETTQVAALKPEADEPKAKRVVAVAAPQPKKTRGPDPFSLESKAAEEAAAREKAESAQKALDDAKKQDVEEKLKQAEDAKAVELAKADEAQIDTFIPVRAAIPQRRPGPTMQVALAPEANDKQESSLSPVQATELALAPTPSPAPVNQQVLRPAVEVPVPTASTEPVTDRDVAKLKQRIETALARPRELSASEEATRLQSNAKLAAALKTVPVPTSPSVRPTTSQPALLALAKPDEALTLPAKLTVPQQPIAKIRAANTASADALPNSVSTPSWKSSAVAPNKQVKQEDGTYQVPVPTSQPLSDEGDTNIAAIPTGSDTAEANFLELGNLDGTSVKKWAVSHSTRVGPVAQLQAPVYKQSTTRVVPRSVYSVGFAFKTAPLRSDRFTGRALTRVAFAHFNNDN